MIVKITLKEHASTANILIKKLTDEPCFSCSDNHSQWEGNNERSNYCKDSQKE